MRTRRAELSDLPAIMALEDGSFGPRRWDEGFIRELMVDEDVLTMVAEDMGIVAYVMFSVSRPYETVEVLSLAVSPEFRGKGIARMLMANVESMAERDARTVSLCVRPDNREAVNLYLSLGYKVLALCSGYYEDGSDAYMMVKHLE
ncbi:MAG TPA: N-acetyltransferase [Methanomassiliicoccales archaeon]|nr:N-acetyltransferase [Methanomassiliicoccales archaeon]